MRRYKTGLYSAVLAAAERRKRRGEKRFNEYHFCVGENYLKLQWNNPYIKNWLANSLTSGNHFDGKPVIDVKDLECRTIPI